VWIDNLSTRLYGAAPVPRDTAPTSLSKAKQKRRAQVGAGCNADDQFDLLRPLVDAIGTTFGQRCEAVLHDFRQRDASIVAIAGNLTDRHIGGSVSEIGLAIMAAGDDAKPQYNYVTRAPNGRVLKSTTVPLRDPQGHVFGMLCINVDVTELRMLSNVLSELIGSGDEEPPQPVTFVDDVGQLLDQVIQEEELAVGKPIDRFNRHNRLDILEALERRGVFSVQRSVPKVAEYLGVSRATVYGYLRQLRDDGAADSAESG
jgi:predicted transcriptional regulator YheO